MATRVYLRIVARTCLRFRGRARFTCNKLLTLRVSPPAHPVKMRRRYAWSGKCSSMQRTSMERNKKDSKEPREGLKMAPGGSNRGPRAPRGVQEGPSGGPLGACWGPLGALFGLSWTPGRAPRGVQNERPGLSPRTPSGGQPGTLILEKGEEEGRRRGRRKEGEGGVQEKGEEEGRSEFPAGF